MGNMENKNWQDEAVEKAGLKVPEWELEPTAAEQKESMEAGVEVVSVAEKRLEEIAKEAKVISPENPEQKAVQVEALRAEVAEMAKPEQKPVVQESVPTKTKVLMSQPINMERVIPDAPIIREVGGGYIVNSYDFEKKAIKEASGGLIEYVPSSKQNKFGYEFEGGANIPPEKLGKLEANLEAAESNKSREAFDYVKIPDNEPSAKRTKNLELNDEKGFSSALNAKKSHSENVRKNIWMGSIYGAATALAGGLGTAIIGGGGTAMSTLGVGIMIGGGGGILALGALGWMGKKIYDSYKEKKAAKNFIIASVAQNVRRSLKNTP